MNQVQDSCMISSLPLTRMGFLCTLLLTKFVYMKLVMNSVHNQRMDGVVISEEFLAGVKVVALHLERKCIIC